MPVNKENPAMAEIRNDERYPAQIPVVPVPNGPGRYDRFDEDDHFLGGIPETPAEELDPEEDTHL